MMALLELSRWASVSLRVVFVIEAMLHQCKSPFVCLASNPQCLHMT